MSTVKSPKTRIYFPSFPLEDHRHERNILNLGYYSFCKNGKKEKERKSDTKNDIEWIYIYIYAILQAFRQKFIQY